MKSIKLKINLFCLLCVFIFSSCAQKLNILVEVNENEKIEITNLGTKNISNLDVRIFNDIDTEARVYSKTIDSISGNEKIIVPIEDLKNSKGNAYPKNQKIKLIRFADAKDTTKELYTWKYTPVYSNPAGYTFLNDDTKIKFFKYANEGTVESSYKYSENIWTEASDRALPKGKFHMENDKIVMECGNYIWDGTLEDDELKIKLRGGAPQGAGFLFRDSYTLYKEKGSDKNLINKQENENISNYEDSLLLMIKQTYKKEEAIIEYAKIYHNDEYNSVKGDEFAWHEKKEEYSKEFEKKFQKLIKI